jgi:hypothetical protein
MRTELKGRRIKPSLPRFSFLSNISHLPCISKTLENDNDGVDLRCAVQKMAFLIVYVSSACEIQKQ